MSRSATANGSGCKRRLCRHALHVNRLSASRLRFFRVCVTCQNRGHLQEATAVRGGCWESLLQHPVSSALMSRLVHAE